MAIRTLILAAVLVLAMAVPTTASASPRLKTSSGKKYKPKKFHGLNHSYFTKMKWSKWNDAKAVARATVHTQYPEAEPYTARVTVRLSRPKRICGSWLYTRVTWRNPGDSTSNMASLMSKPCVWTGA